MTQNLVIAALLSVALISPICAAAERGAASPTLGRLFFSQSQRAELDRRRSAPPVSPSKPAVRVVAKPVTPPSSPSPEIVTVNGIVQRSDGQSTVWINDRPVSDQDESTIAIRDRGEGGQITLQIPESAHRLPLKVGQRADLRTGEISERFSQTAGTAWIESGDVEAMGSKPERMSEAKRSVSHRSSGSGRQHRTYE